MNVMTLHQDLFPTRPPWFAEPQPSDDRVQPARRADIPGIRRIVATLALSGKILNRSTAEIRATLPFWRVVRVRGRIVGCVALQPHTATAAEVRSLVVDDAHQGTGLGNALVRAAVALAAADGYEQVLATTATLSVFEAAGFSVLPGAPTRVPYANRPVRSGYVVMGRPVIHDRNDPWDIALPRALVMVESNDG